MSKQIIECAIRWKKRPISAGLSGAPSDGQASSGGFIGLYFPYHCFHISSRLLTPVIKYYLNDSYPQMLDLIQESILIFDTFLVNNFHE
jgi:hypothetical protein